MTDEARILIVDDSRIFRAALEAALGGQNGITVVGSVFNGTKALEFIRAKPPDLVTLDVEMPGMDGLQTLQAIQEVNAARAPGTEIGVIMVSSFTRRGAQVTMRASRPGPSISSPSRAVPPSIPAWSNCARISFPRSDCSSPSGTAVSFDLRPPVRLCQCGR